MKVQIFTFEISMKLLFAERALRLQPTCISVFDSLKFIHEIAKFICKNKNNNIQIYKLKPPLCTAIIPFIISVPRLDVRAELIF